MTPLNESFEKLIYPSEFIKNFTDDEHFKEWLHSGTINDCKACLLDFEHAEEYKHCGLIQEVIDEKVDTMLSGLGFED